MSEQNPTPDAPRQDPVAGAPTPGQGGYAAPQYDPTAYGQQGYGQQGYAQPPYAAQPGSGQADQGYYSTPQEYGQSQQYPPYAQYPQYSQYPQAGYQQEWPAEQPRSSTLGVVGLGLVVVCAVILAVASFSVGGHIGQFALDYGLEALENPDPTDPLFVALTQQMQGVSTAIMLSCVGGLVGWIISIVATARRQGRPFGIWGIVLGVLAPIAGIVALVAGMMPAMQVLAG